MPQARVIPATDPSSLNAAAEEAAGLLRAGMLVAFPTETVYGLGADASSAEAIGEVFRAKGRPADNPLIVHLSDIGQVSGLTEDFPETAKRCAEAFWPGPLTLVLRGNGTVPANATAGLSTVAVRVPDHPVARALAARLDMGIVGPSANLSGRPSPTTASHVLADLGDRIAAVVDAGPTRQGVESTVLDMTGRQPAVLRLGALPVETLESVVGHVIAGDPGQQRRSPGTMHRHYAPRARLFIVRHGDRDGFDRVARQLEADGKRFGAMLATFTVSTSGPIVRMGTNAGDYARHLFAALRDLDAHGLDAIIAEEPEAEGVGRTVIDRLRRAAAASGD